jgi:hypothetical protein
MNERERVKRRAKNPLPKLGRNFTEAIGKAIAGRDQEEYAGRDLDV